MAALVAIAAAVWLPLTLVCLTGLPHSHPRRLIPYNKEAHMGIFDKDPKYQALKAIRDSCYDGPVDQDGNKAEDKTGILDALRKK